MKYFLFFALIVSFYELGAVLRGFDKKSLQVAFLNILASMEESNHLVSIIMVGNTTHQAPTAAILPQASGVPHKVSHIHREIDKFALDSSAIMIFDSAATLKRFNDDVEVSLSFTVSQRLFVYVELGTYADVKSVGPIGVDWLVLKFEYFVLEEAELIRLLTFVIYEPGKCGIPHLVEVNRFDKSCGKWQHGRFTIVKFSNFNGCELNFLIGSWAPNYILNEADDNEETIIVKECGGFSCAVLRDFGSVLNYTRKMVLHHDWMKNGTDRRLRIDMSFRAVPMSAALAQNKLGHVFTRPVYTFEKFIAISPGYEYNGYEKMALPFDGSTWLCVCFTFVAAFGTIFSLRFVRPDIANFVMGRRTAAPVLNVLRIFFGQASTFPSRNFARFLLLEFILFSLIIRTAYQGKTFEFLQKEMRKETVKTVEEMIKENFTFYVEHAFKKLYNDSEIATRGIFNDHWTQEQLDAAYINLYTPGTKTGFIYFFMLHAEFVKDKKFQIKEPPKLLKDRYLLESVVYSFPPLHFLFEVFDRKLQQYVEADLINYNTRAWEEDLKRKMFKQQESFSVLTLGELEAGFVVCLLPLVFSAFVFAMEWLVNLKNLIVFLIVFKNFYAAKDLEQANHSEVMKMNFATWQEISRKQKKFEKELAARQDSEEPNKFYMTTV